MSTHSSILAWGIPWTEEPGGLQSMGSKESDMSEQPTLQDSVRLSFTSLSSNFLLYLLYNNLSMASIYLFIFQPTCNLLLIT